MLSLFPALLPYSLVVPFVFRIVSGALFVYIGYANLTRHRASKIALFGRFRLMSGNVWLAVLAALEAAGGLMLISGLFTQGAALALSFLLILGLIARKKQPEAIFWSGGFLCLLLLITASLLFLGPGFYAFDLPL